MKKLDLHQCSAAHLEHDEAVFDAAGHLGFAIGAVDIMDGEVNDLEVALGGPEDELVIAPAVVDAPGAAELLDMLVIGAPEDLGAAEGVLDAGIEYIGEGDAEKLVADDVEELHGILVHGVHEAGAIDELAVAAGDGLIEIGQLLGDNGEVGIQDHKDIALGFVEAGPYVHGLADAGGVDEPDVFLGVLLHHGADDIGCAVRRLVVAENDLGMGAELGNARDGIFDIAGFIAAGDNDADGVVALRRENGAGYGEAHHGEITEKGQPRKEAVQYIAEEGDIEREENEAAGEYRIVIGESEQVVNVGGADPVVQALGDADMELLGELDERLPEVVVIHYHYTGMRSAAVAQPIEDSFDVYNILYGCDEDVVELLLDLECLRVLVEEIKVRIVGARLFDLAAAVIHAYTVGGIELIQDKADAAAYMEHPAARLDNELERADEALIVIGIVTYPLDPLGRDAVVFSRNIPAELVKIRMAKHVWQ